MKLFSLPHALQFPIIVIVTLLCKVNPAFSQASNIVPDDTLGESSSQVIENADGQPNELITGGAQREQNLFHSFQEFNVSEGRGAFFANPEAVSNIFSRVTGNNPSNILGVLGVNGAANLYLINPNGIVFGENSSLNVQGSFTATTGNGIRFGEQGEFNTINPQAPQLLTIDPSAYLFNQIADGDINSIQSQGSLQVPNGEEHLVLLGGDIDLRGSNLVAPGGTVSLGSVNDTAEIGVSEDSNLIFSQEIAGGDISLSEGSSVDVSAEGSGFINVYSQNLNLSDRSQMVAGISQGLGNSNTVGGDIVIDVLETVSLNDSSISNTIGENAEGTTGKTEVSAESVVLQNGGIIIANIFGLGNVGEIEIDATESVIVDGENIDGDSSRISSYIFSQGKADNLEINTGLLDVTNGGRITSDIAGIGDGGDITITATESVLVDGERSDEESSRISNIIFSDTQGNAGNLEINTGLLDVTNGGRITSDVEGTGDGGDITITATESVLVDGERSDGQSSRISSIIFSETQGKAGNLEINTGLLDVTSGGRITSDILGTGDGGNITITATESVIIDGEKDNGFSSRISSNINSDAQGKAGNLEITTSSLNVTNGGLIVSKVRGIGDGGDITITEAESVVVDGESSSGESSSITANRDAKTLGDTGSIRITTSSLNVTNGGLISTDTSGIGDGGDITVTEAESVVVDGESSSGESSSITSNTDSPASFTPGEIIITTNSLKVTNGGSISSNLEKNAAGKGGNITIDATESVVVDGESSNGESSSITTNIDSGAEDNAGNLEITTGSLRVTNGGLISNDTFGIDRGDESNITIDATELVVVDGESSNGESSRISNIIGSRANGSTGELKITTGSLRLTNGGSIRNDVEGLGITDNITIDATESVVVDGESSSGESSQISSIIFSDAFGDVGNIRITTNSLEVINGGSIKNDTSGEGDGGDITITEAESVVVDGESSSGESSSITSNTDSETQGDAGSIGITTTSLEVTNGGLISTDTSGFGEGGDITITKAESVIADGENSNGESSSITSNTDSESFDDAGNIGITTTSLEVTNGAFISTDTSGRGNAGDINIDATKSVVVDGEFSFISSSTGFEAVGGAGNIGITTTSLEVTNGASISSLISIDTFNLEDTSRGQISIDADFVLLEDSIITTESNSEENAGNIALRNFNTLVLENSSIASNSSESSGGEITIIGGGDIRLRGDSDIITNVDNGAGGGGNITITADSVIAFDDSDIFAFARDGTGGIITLNTPVFFSENFTFNSLTDNPDFLDNNSRADVNATGAVSGTVSVPDVSFVQNSLSELPDNSLNTDELLANSCVVPIGNREQGKFIITGGESLPVRPGDSLPSRYSTGEVRNLPDDNSWQPGDRIVEPQGAYRLANGKLVLSRECQ